MPTTLTLEQVTSTKGFYIDINSLKHDFEFTMDWFSPKPFLKVPNGRVTGTEILERAMGSYSIWVVEPLRMGPGVADTVDINVWRYAGDNFNVSLLAENNATLVVSDRTAIGPLRAVKQSGESTMKHGTKPIDINGEKIRSIKEIFKRRNLWIVPSGVSPFGFNISEMLFRNRNQTTWVGGGSGTPYQPGRGLTVWYGSGYRGWHGTTRFRVQYLPGLTAQDSTVLDAGMMVGYLNGSATSEWVLTAAQTTMIEGLRKGLFVDETVTEDLTSFFLQSTPAITFSDPGCNVLDVEVPFYAAEKFKILSSGSELDTIQPTDDEANVGTFFVAMPGPFFKVVGTSDTRMPQSGKLGTARVWIAGGDDLRCGIYLGPPNISVLPKNLGNDSYPAV